MRSQVNIRKQVQETETQTLAYLKSNYERLSLDLIVCAQHIPGEDLRADQEMQEREERLLSSQEDILEQLANYTISSEAESTELADFWSDLHKTEDSDLPSRQSVSVFNNVLSFNRG